MTAPASPEILEALYRVLLSRKGGDPETSYTAGLFAQGEDKILEKLGEEAIETLLAAKNGDPDAVVRESADLLFHWLVLMAEREIPPERVWAELAERFGISGLEEKAARIEGRTNDV